MCYYFTTIAEENATAMDTTSLFQSYEKFSRLLLDEKLYRNPKISFASICERIGADKDALGLLVEREMGMTADELIEAYRSQER